MLTFETSTQWLEIPDTVHTQFWQPSMASDRWQAYLNQVCLRTVLPWLQEKSGIEPEVASLDTPEFWELVNGSAVRLGDTRLILVPTEAMDWNELRVPQEWIDIPSWIGDYYLAVEVDTDEQVLQIWGYATHEQIKSQGKYDPSDRTYQLTGDGFIQDLAVFWVMQQLATEPTRAGVPTLADISTTTATPLIQQLANPDVILPRLELPFQQWGALLQDDRYLQTLCQQRRQHQPSPVEERSQSAVQLSQWMQNLFETGWQTMEAVLGTTSDLAFSFRGENDQPLVQRVKPIQLSTDLNVVLAIAIELAPDNRRRIGVQVLPEQAATVLPSHLQLRMTSPTGDVLQSVESSDRSRYIQLRPFKCAPGTAFRLQIQVADVSVTEDFVA
jgi:hypothetical protein